MFSKKLFNFKFLIIIALSCSLSIAIFTRFSGLTSFPSSLYWEEVALGYDAYSILQTARDHHGNFLPLVAFKSFGDYKPSFYFYSLIPSIAILGLTDLAVRVPSALSGVVLVLIVGFIAREVGYSLTENSFKKKSMIPAILQVIATFVTSINPWAIQFSRGAWEVNVATTLLAFGLYLQLLVRRTFFINKEIHAKIAILLLSVSVFSIALSMYTYHATRIIAPVALLLFWILVTCELWLKEKLKVNQFIFFLKNKVLYFLISGMFFSALILPILLSSNSMETQQRFSETNLFAAGQHVLISNQLIAESQPKWLGKIIYHRYLIESHLVVENYLKHFSIRFLFISGDSNPRHSSQFVGLFYSGDFLIILAGLYFMFKKRTLVVIYILLWLVIGVVPASLTTAAPHALRILPSLPAWMMIVTVGIYQVWLWISTAVEYYSVNHKVKTSRQVIFGTILLTVLSFYALQFVSYWRFYSVVYPKQYSNEWQYGYKQMVEELLKGQAHYPTLPVQVTREYGRPAMYYWFYSQTNPKDVQTEELVSKKDQGEFISYKNISFIDQFSSQEKTLVASSQLKYLEQVNKKQQIQVLNQVIDPLGKVIWVVYVLN